MLDAGGSLGNSVEMAEAIGAERSHDPWSFQPVSPLDQFTSRSKTALIENIATILIVYR
jgi:hypothetical protein